MSTEEDLESKGTSSTILRPFSVTAHAHLPDLDRQREGATGAFLGQVLVRISTSPDPLALAPMVLLPRCSWLPSPMSSGYWLKAPAPRVLAPHP